MSKKYRVRLLLLDQAYYIAIGRAITTWAALEIQIDEQLLRMLNHEKSVPIRTRNNINRLDDIPKQLKARLKLFDELARVHYVGQPLQGFLGVSKRSLTLSKNRHRLAHGEWITKHLPRKTPKMVSRIRRMGTHGKERIFTIKQIRHLTHEICDVYADLHYLMLEHHPDGPLPKRLREYFRSLEGNDKPKGYPGI